MNMVFRSALVALALSAASTQADAHATYIGYSGAPGSGGQCAASCHGVGGGTVQISGFPTEYAANQAYTVTISHSGGSTIRQFNGSCRVGAGTQNAGVIAAGTNTVAYNTPGETNGIHLTTTNLDSATFTWTAPAAGTGEVKLYVGGHQGSLGGANTTLVLTATEQTTGLGDGYPVIDPAGGFLTASFPNPFSSQTTIGFSLAQPSAVLLEIYNSEGQRLESYATEQSAGYHEFIWSSPSRPAGVYYYRIQAGNHSETRKMLLVK